MKLCCSKHAHFLQQVVCDVYRQLEELQSAAHHSKYSQLEHGAQSSPQPGSVNVTILRQMNAKQKRIEALEQAARAVNSQHQTDLAEQRQQVSRLRQQLGSLHKHLEAVQAVSIKSGRAQSKAKKPMLVQQQDSDQLSVRSLQELLYAAQCQLAEQAQQIAKLQQEATAADTQLEKLTNLLQAQEAHSQRLEVQLDSKADAAKSRFAKVSEHLESERRTVKALRAELQSLSTSTESHVSRLATELEAKQGLLRGLQTTVHSAKADAECSRSQAEAATSAIACLREAGLDLDRVSAQLNSERQVQSYCWCLWHSTKTVRMHCQHSGAFPA